MTDAEQKREKTIKDNEREREREREKEKKKKDLGKNSGGRPKRTKSGGRRNVPKTASAPKTVPQRKKEKKKNRKKKKHPSGGNGESASLQKQ